MSSPETSESRETRESYEPKDSNDESYEPEVDDYVIWEQKTWCGITTDQGWVYFKGDVIEPRKGFTTHSRYITIETGVKDKPPEQLEFNGDNPHKKIHTLLLCYESQWKDLQFVKHRESKVVQHYAQYDDRT